MQIACPSCKKTIVLEDSKVPSGPFKLKCPGCATSIPVMPGGSVPPAPPAQPSPAASAEDPPEVPVDEAMKAMGLEPGSPTWERLKHEVAHQVLWHLGVVKYREDDGDEEEENKRQALVVEDEAIFQQAITEALRSLRYRVDVVGDKQKALDVLSRKTFDLVTVDNRLPDDPEGGYQVLQAINALPPDQRRRMFVAFISADLATMDTQSAFVLGANLTVGKKDLRRLDKILQQAIKEHDKIYHIFRSVHEELQSQET
jgi:CheY-like chemotaxis protein